MSSSRFVDERADPPTHRIKRGAPRPGSAAVASRHGPARPSCAGPLAQETRRRPLRPRPGLLPGARGGHDKTAQELLVPARMFIALVVAAVASLGTPLITSVATSFHVSLGSAQWTLTVATMWHDADGALGWLWVGVSGIVV